MRLLKQISKLRLQFQEERSWFLLQNNASAHSPTTVKHFLVKCNAMDISHQFHPPDLEPAIFSLFSKSENHPQRVNISGYPEHQEECNPQKKCSFIACHQ
jgi:hypothetical protein